MNYTVLGVDPSTKTGLAFIDGTEVSTSVIQYEKMKGMQRIALLQSEFEERLYKWNPGVVVVEGYGFANKFTLSLMVEIGCAYRLVLHKSGIPWYYVPPTVLKKYAVGNGAAKKPQVAAAVKDRWGFNSPSDDVVDAYVLAKIGQELSVSGVSTDLKGVERG